MEETKEKKIQEQKQKKDGTIWFILLIGILVIFLGVTIFYCYKLRQELKNQQEIIQNEVSNIDANNTFNQVGEAEQEKSEKVTLKKDTSKDLVYTEINKKSKNNYSFEIPYVNINSDYANKINKEIKELYPDIEQLIYEATHYGETINIISYETYINNNVLSLVINEESDIANYYVYNIDIYTGEQVSNSEILSSKEVSKTKFLDRVDELCTSAVERIYEDYDDIKVKKQSISETINKNHNMELKIFLDKNNNINIIPLIYNSIAQFTETEEIINTKL